MTSASTALCSTGAGDLLKARCQVCAWRVKASGEAFLNMAVQAHREVTGHDVKVP